MWPTATLSGRQHGLSFYFWMEGSAASRSRAEDIHCGRSQILHGIHLVVIMGPSVSARELTMLTLVMPCTSSMLKKGPRPTVVCNDTASACTGPAAVRACLLGPSSIFFQAAKCKCAVAPASRRNCRVPVVREVTQTFIPAASCCRYLKNRCILQEKKCHTKGAEGSVADVRNAHASRHKDNTPTGPSAQ